MTHINRVILAGRLTTDPEIRYTGGEKAVAVFRLAIKKDKTESYIECIAQGDLAKICGEYLKKGKLIALEGELVTGKHTHVLVDNLQMLDSKFLNTPRK